MSELNNNLINRDISWLSFNDRVLQEARDENVPLVERVKFLGIFSNNLDEFFRVRVASHSRTMHDAERLHKKDLHSKKILDKIYDRVIELQDKFEETFSTIVDELENQNIFIVNESELTKKQGEYVKNYFQEMVRPSLVPILLHTAPKFPYLKDRAIYFAIKLSGKKDNTNKDIKYSIIQIPTDVLPRFVELPNEGQKKFIILLDDIIRYCLTEIYSIFHYEKIEAFTIKLTRDAELDINDDFSKSYTEKIAASIKGRKRGKPVRLNYDAEIPKDLLDFLIKKLKMRDDTNVIPGGRYHNFRNFMKFQNLGSVENLYKPMPPVEHKDFKNKESLLDVIKRKDILLTYPYQTFNHILDILREAAIDPRVESIKINLYRVAENSNVMYTLLNAIKNGKKVVAVLELQARFDEENNMYWANKLQEEGAAVKFGIPGLKVHSKLFLISKRENGKLVNYAHIGTGNFNEVTARIYTDHSLLTADERITSEVEKVFDFFQVNYRTGTYKNLLVSPFYMRLRIEKLIEAEILNAKAGKKAYITLKLNNLEDPGMINLLYKASQAGVKIKIILRGICCLVPGRKGISDNISVVSIIDKFLEHTRVFLFANDGDEKLYISSADLMGRNLDVRTEVACPIYSKEIQTEIKKILAFHFTDNTKARIIDVNMKNQYVKSRGPKIQSQQAIYNYFLEKSKQ